MSPTFEIQNEGTVGTARFHYKSLVWFVEYDQRILQVKEVNLIHLVLFLFNWYFLLSREECETLSYGGGTGDWSKINTPES